MRPSVVAIVPSAGSGKRLGSKTKKPFILLKGKPLVVHALQALNKSPAVDAILIAAEKPCVSKMRNIVRRFKLDKVVDVVEGGRTRSASVSNCLDKIEGLFDIVLIHDGARPFIDEDTIRESVAISDKFGSCVVAVPESDTVKHVGHSGFIKKTLDRKHIYRAQTPQVFKRKLLAEAYRRAAGKTNTDDSSIVEGLGVRVKILEGSYRNIKITTREDLKLAEVLL